MKGVLYVVLAQLCFALIGVFTKYIGSAIDSTSLVFFRVFIAAGFLLFFASITKNIKTLSLKKSDIKPFLILGVLFTLNFVFFLAAYVRTSIIEVGILTSIMPAIAYIMAYRILGEKITKNGILALVVVLLGVVVMNTAKFEQTHFIGNIFVIISSVFAAAQITYMRLEERNHSSLDTMFWTMIFASALLSPFMIGFNFTAISSTIYTWVLLLGVISTGIAYLFASSALKHMEVGKYALISNIAFPLISIIFGIVYFNETLSVNIIAGGSLLMLSAAILHYEHRAPPFHLSGFKEFVYKIRMFNGSFLKK